MALLVRFVHQVTSAMLLIWKIVKVNRQISVMRFLFFSPQKALVLTISF